MCDVESCGFITSGRSGGVDRSVMSRLSNDPSTNVPHDLLLHTLALHQPSWARQPQVRISGNNHSSCGLSQARSSINNIKALEKNQRTEKSIMESAVHKRRDQPILWENVILSHSFFYKNARFHRDWIKFSYPTQQKKQVTLETSLACCLLAWYWKLNPRQQTKYYLQTNITW